jgi:Phytanoyl-CoA dioxygenase (PhyH)
VVFVRRGKRRYWLGMSEFARRGFTLVPQACTSADLERIEAALAGVDAGRAGVRLHGLETMSIALASGGCIGAVAAQWLGSRARAVRAILFDKSALSNWSLGWHQDRTIVVKQRRDVEGFGPWTVKADLHHVAPPYDLLARMVTLRLHLDPVDDENAPLLVAVGSHQHGKIAEHQIEAIVEGAEIVSCHARRGDIWVYATPILHASAASRSSARRRVLQVDYSADDLPSGLEWLGV